MEEPLCRGTLFAKAGGQGAVCLHGSVAVQILNVRMGLECWTGPAPRGGVEPPVGGCSPLWGVEPPVGGCSSPWAGTAPRGVDVAGSQGGVTEKHRVEDSETDLPFLRDRSLSMWRMNPRAHGVGRDVGMGTPCSHDGPRQWGLAQPGTREGMDRLEGQ